MNGLSENQLVDLTGYRRPSYQRRWLLREQLPFQQRADGTVLLSAQVVEEYFNGSRRTRRSDRPSSEPNFEGFAA